MKSFRSIVFSGTLLFGAASLGWAQQGGQQAGGFGQGGAVTGGFQQTGQLSSTAAIQRDPNALVGSNTGSFLSRSGTSGVTGRGGTTGGIGGLTGALTGAAFGGAAGGGFGRGFGGGFGNQQFGGAGGFTNATTAGSTSQLRIPVRIGFQARPISSTLISTRFGRRLTNIPALQLTTPVAVKMDGRTAVLQGAVASVRQRDLIERLAKLEPGVSSVRNELTVDSALGQPESLPAGAGSAAIN